MKEIDEYFLNQKEPLQSCLSTLREFILDSFEGMEEQWKYKMPCYSLGHKLICYLWVDKKTTLPYLLMVDGNKMQHPLLVSGKRARMKVFYIDPNEDIPVDLIQEIIIEGIEVSKG